MSLRQQSTGRLLKGAMSALVLGSVLYLGLYEFPKANWKEVMQVMADDDAAQPAAYPWHHKKKTGSFDAARCVCVCVLCMCCFFVECYYY